MFLISICIFVSIHIHPLNVLKDDPETIKLTHFDININSNTGMSFDSSPSKDPQRQPTIIVVASINGGTSTLNSIFLFHYKHFFHGFKHLFDLHYWIACIPKQYYQSIGIHPSKHNHTSFYDLYHKLRSNVNYKSWNISFDHLDTFSYSTAPDTYHKNIKCTHKDYMEHIGNTKSRKYKKYFYKEYMLETKDNTRFPKESDAEMYYFHDRSSSYNSLPYIPMVLSKNYPHSKLIYIVRDPFDQINSRFRHFDKETLYRKTPSKEQKLDRMEANSRFGELLQFINRDQCP